MVPAGTRHHDIDTDTKRRGRHPFTRRRPRLSASVSVLGCYRQERLSVAEPLEPVVYVRFGSDSQEIDPSGFFLMNLYWKVVFGGRTTDADHVGYVAGDKAIARDGSHEPTAAIEPTR